MLGLRGCRLGVLFPEIYEMQARAIFEAAVAVAAATGETVVPEVMIPLVGSARELRADQGARSTRSPGRGHGGEAAAQLDYQVGTMIELPRAALRADEIARARRVLQLRHQRPDPDDARPVARRFGQVPGRLHASAGIFAGDPFQTLDHDGRRRAGDASPAERGRATRPDLKLGICGEHGGDPASIAFCERVGLDYVSCSPYRVPIARLAAAQAAPRPSAKAGAREQDERSGSPRSAARGRQAPRWPGRWRGSRRRPTRAATLALLDAAWAAPRART